MRPALAASLAGGAAASLLAASVLASDGSSDGRVAWIGAGAVLAAAAAGVAALLGRLAMPALSRSAVACVVLLTAFVAWNGVSVLWSSEPDRTWSYFNRGLAYLALVVLGLVVGAHVRQAPRLVAGGFALLLAGVVVWALAVKSIPALDSDYGRVARLHTPIGYWNALALLFDAALPLALWLATRREHPHALRAGGIVLFYASIVALLLTYSRGGVAVAVLVLVAWFAIVEPRLESVFAVALAVPAALGVALWALSRPGLANDREPYSARLHDGTLFGVVVVLVGAAVWAAAFAASRLERRRELSAPWRRLLGRIAAATLALAVAAAGVGLALRGPRPSQWLRDFTQSSSGAQVGPYHFTTLSSTSRWGWWKEAWHGFEDNPLKGTGAGTFELTDRRLRPNRLAAVEPHNLPLQFLSETGIVGFLLACGASVAWFVALARRWRLGADAPATALALFPAAYLLHALVDFDWDFIAVSAPLFVVLGVLLAAERPARVVPRPRPLWALGAALLAAAALSSLLVPWFAARKVDDAFSALERGAARAAADDAREAHDLNPLALEPLFAWAAAEAVQGRDADARRLYVRAVRLQPLNSRSWYELGRFELARGSRRDAIAYLERAAQLDPQGPAKALIGQVPVKG